MAINNELNEMDDPMRQEWSRHYDTLVWQVTTIFTAGVGTLFAYSLSESTTKLWPEVAGVALALLGVFYVARFRVFRSILHGGIKNKGLNAFLANPGGGKYLHMWNAFVLPFFVACVVFIYKLAAKTVHFRAIFVCGSLLVFLAFLYLWKMGKSESK